MVRKSDYTEFVSLSPLCTVHRAVWSSADESARYKSDIVVVVVVLAYLQPSISFAPEFGPALWAALTWGT